MAHFDWITDQLALGGRLADAAAGLDRHAMLVAAPIRVGQLWQGLADLAQAGHIDLLPEDVVLTASPIGFSSSAAPPWPP